MTEMGQLYQEMRDYRRDRRFRERVAKDRRELAVEMFEDAAGIAEQAGLSLVQRTQAHYHLLPADGSWLINLYPGNQRIYHDRNKPGPFLRLARDRAWDLIDAVEAAITALKKS